MRLGIATDHGGFSLKEDLVTRLRAAGHEVVDFGATVLDTGDDYPDFVVPLAHAVAEGKVKRHRGLRQRRRSVGLREQN
jgi:ribose 5-phosphate isomerase B